MKEQSQVFNNGNENEKGQQFLNSAGFLGKVFFYLFIGLLISAAICLGMSYALFYAFGKVTTDTAVESVLMTYFGIMIVCGIGLLILTIIISLRRFKMHNIIVPYILYCVFMGGLLSGFLLFVGNPYIIGSALAITSVLFLTMCIFGFLYKGKLGWVFGLLLGGAVSMGLLFLVNMFLFPIAFGVESAFDAYCTIYWIMEAIFFLMIMVSTALDMYNIRKISESGSDQTNLALYCALNLYSDFIMIFIRVVYFLILVSGKRDN